MQTATGWRQLAEPRAFNKALPCGCHVTQISAPSVAVTVPYNDPSAKRYRYLRRLRYLRRFLIALYIAFVAVGCFGFQFWGCFCHDPAYNNSNPWNTIATADGVVVVECADAFLLSRALGVEWCCVAAGMGATHMYVTLPALAWIARIHTRRIAALVLAEGLAVGVGQTALLALSTSGHARPDLLAHMDNRTQDSLAGEMARVGVEAVPLGAAVVAGFGAWLLVSVLAFVGFRQNRRLGVTMVVTGTYVVAAVGVGTLAMFHLHLLLGLGLIGVLLVVFLWSAQVFVTTTLRKLALLAYLAPLVVGAALGVPIEFLELGLPPLAGYAIGCGVAFVSVVLLSHVYERGGVPLAKRLAALLLVQDAVVLAASVAGHNLHWAAGLVMLISLELILVSTADVVVREGNQFGAWICLSPLIEAGVFMALLVGAYDGSWGLAVTIGMSIAICTTALVWWGFRRAGVVGGMRAIFLSAFTCIHANFILLELLIARIDQTASGVYGGLAYVLLLLGLWLMLRHDDGSGRLYGSGVEIVIYFVIAQTWSYCTAILMFEALDASAVDVHVSAAVQGALLLLMPALCGIIAAKGSTATTARLTARRNFRRGVYVALWLMGTWIVTVLELHYMCDVGLSLSIHISSGYAAGFAVVVLLAIWRYLTTLLLTYMIFLFSSVGAVFLIYIQGFPFLPVVSLAVLSAVGLYPPILILIPLAIQRADTLENAVLDRGARELWQVHLHAHAIYIHTSTYTCIPTRELCQVHIHTHAHLHTHAYPHGSSGRVPSGVRPPSWPSLGIHARSTSQSSVG